MLNYTPHDTLIEPARAYPQLWRLVLGVLAAVFLYVLFVLLYMGAATLLAGEAWVAELSAKAAVLSPVQTLLLLGSLPPLIPAVAISLLVFHKRDPLDVFGPLRKMWQQFGKAMVPALAIAFILLGLSFIFDAPVRNINPMLWLTLLPAALGLLFLQVTAEEVFFRGYLQSQLAARGGHPLIWILIPSIFFGFAHFDPVTMGNLAWAYVAITTLFGILAADLTARTGTLGPAIAFHFANNILAILLLGISDHLSGLALWVTPHSITDTRQMLALLPLDALFMIAMYAAIRWRLRV